MPPYTTVVMQVFLSNPGEAFLKARLVQEARAIGAPLNSHSVAPAVNWLFGRGYIRQVPGPGRHPRYRLSESLPPWPPPFVP